jgi:hypothetical protein
MAREGQGGYVNKKEFLEQFEKEFKNSAFPSEVKYYPDGTLVANTPGLSKREYFALHLLNGYISNAGDIDGDWSNHIKDAIYAADLLIKGLDNEK